MNADFLTESATILDYRYQLSQVDIGNVLFKISSIDNYFVFLSFTIISKKDQNLISPFPTCIFDYLLKKIVNWKHCFDILAKRITKLSARIEIIPVD